ncbi:MAG: hypothetical protein J7K53_06625 [Bacteroidales bacterium]|nr:hypothetical protein [Bacteroidales bacterium]
MKQILYIFKNVQGFLLVLILMVSCRTSVDNSEYNENTRQDSSISAMEIEVSEEALVEIVANIASPIEMAALMNRLGVPFSKRYLANTSSVNDLNTNFQMAYKLGIFGADLGYLNMYEKSSAAVEYISIIKTLADGLRVGQFFDYTTLKRLATNNQNLDSLMFLSVHSYNEIDSYLRETPGRSYLSSLMISGLWIEGLYLITQVAKEYPHPDISERIGEQKIILTDLLNVLNLYKKNPSFNELIRDFETLNVEFKKINITYEIGEPETIEKVIEKDTILVIVQNEKSIVDISEDQLNSIIEKTEKVRNKLIGL